MLAQRTNSEIIAIVLQSAEKGTTQTTLMYETYLSQSAVRGYLASLAEKGFIEYLKGEMKFKTTPKGLEHLSSLIQIKEKTCSHQCGKCGVVYGCAMANCKDPFQNSICQRCTDFYSNHASGIRANETLEKVKPMA